MLAQLGPQAYQKLAEKGPIRVWVYSRVSTAEQAREGISLEMQEQMAEQWCQRNLAGLPYTITKVRDEGDSGKYGWKPTPQYKHYRKGLARVVEAIEQGRVDILLIYSLDRLARNLYVWREFLHSYVDTGKVRLVDIANNIDFSAQVGRTIADVLSMAAEFEREKTAENVRNAIRKRLAEGYPWSTVGYGWRRIPKRERAPGEPPRIEPVPEELEQVKRIIDWFRRGWGARRIARHLQREGVPPPNGAKRWHRIGVRRIIENPLHAGLVRCGDSFVRGVHFEHRIIEPEEYYELLDELRKRCKENRKRTDDNLFPLWKVARCIRCGAPIQGAHRHRYGTRMYRCRGSDFDEHETCRPWQRSAELIERVVLKRLAAFAARPEFQELLKRTAQRHVMEMEVQRLEEEKERLEKALRDLQRQRQRLLSAYTRGVCAEEDYEREYRRIEADRQQLTQQLEQVERLLANQSRREQLLQQVKETVQHLPRVWAALNPEERRQLLASLLEYIYIGPLPDGRFVVRMKMHFLPEVTEELPNARSRASGLFDDVEHLTKRELAALYWLQKGWDVKKIAEHWQTTREAVHYLIRSVKRRLGVDDIRQAVALAAHRLDAEKDTLPLGPTGWHVGRPKSSEPLTPRMKQILEDYIDGLSVEESARKHGISPKTVSVLRWKVRQRLGVKTLDEAAQIYLASQTPVGAAQ